MLFDWRFLIGAAGALRLHSAGSRMARVVMLTAALGLVGVMPARADTIVITIGSDGQPVQGLPFFDGTLGTPQNFTWQFWQLDGGSQAARMVYSFRLAGTPTNSFFVNVTDRTVTNDGLVNVPPNMSCVMGVLGSCLVFTATAFTLEPEGLVPAPATPDWLDGYRATILWIQLGEAPPPDTITILKHHNENFWDFGNADFLSDIRYAPNLNPPDPGIGGKGDTFSTFGVFAGDVPPATIVTTKDELYNGTPVPEPASVILLATGLAGLAFRARRRRQ